MPSAKPTTWLVCYDISDPRRLQRVHKTISRHGIPLQYSVFLIEGTRLKVIKIINRTVGHIDTKHLEIVDCHPV